MSRKRKTPEAPRPPKVPGVRYVKTTVYDVEARTFEGETSYRQVPRTAWVPAPPRDWDAMVARALVCAAILGTVLSLGWSTESIGHLLDRTGSDVTAYAVAIVFDVVWLACQAREWLEREYPERAEGAKAGGYVCLILAMAAIFANGYEAGETIAGASGAAVSALAKFLWVLALGYYAVELDEGAAYDLHARRQRIAVRLALRASRRRLEATEAYERHVYGDQGGLDVQVTRYEAPETSPAAVPAPVSPPVPAVSPAPAPVSLPTPPPAPPAPAPAATVPPVSPPAPAVPEAPVPPAVAPTGDTSPVASPAPAPVEPVKQSRPTPAASPALQVVGGKTDFIRSAIAADPGITLDDLTDQVRETYGDKPNLRKDVRRLRARIEGKAS
ncbi:hypothetical protein [Streptomyces olivaceus]|uniref:hypothetical protein n=1 Tax=Streptomyces olivaceus TaxID=47716 RepID=UPI003634AA67